MPRDVPMSSPIVKEKDLHEMQEEKVQFIIDLKFQYDNLCENVHIISLEDKTSVEVDEVIDLYDIFKEEEQPTLNLRIKPNKRIEVVQQN